MSIGVDSDRRYRTVGEQVADPISDVASWEFLSNAFTDLAKSLKENEDAIVNELIECQGDKVDLGGYWMPDPAKVSKAMQPSATLNKILN